MTTEEDLTNLNNLTFDMGSSKLDNKTEEKDHISEESQPITPNSVQSDAVRLDALDNLEILPQILQEGILFGASGAAILLQAAMPNVKRTEGDHHKNLATELGDSLQAFLSYTSCLVFGTRDEKKTLLGKLQRGEHPLRGGDNYATDREVQLWVAATVYATATDFYQRIYGRVNYRTAQKCYTEFSLLINCLGMEPGVWPDSRQTFWNYWDDSIEKLTVTSDSHKFAEDLENDKSLPRWVSMLKPFMRVITIEMLPPRIREAYGLKSTSGTRCMYRSTMGFSVAVYPALPKSLRSYPVRYYLKDLRKHLNV